MFPINYGAVAFCTLLNMILGSLWFSPLLWGRPWMKLMGVDPSTMMKDAGANTRMKIGYVASVICSVTMALVLSYVLDSTHSFGSWKSGLNVGVRCWLGFTLTTMLPNHIFSSRGSPFTLAAIDIGYTLVSTSMMGAILAAWH